MARVPEIVPILTDPVVIDGKFAGSGAAFELFGFEEKNSLPLPLASTLQRATFKMN